MLVTLPHVDGGEQMGTPVGGSAPDDNNGNRKGKRGRVILLAVVLGIVVGIAGWLGWQQKQKNDEQARIELKNERKAHMDSLMQLRNHEEAEERAAQQMKENQEDVINFLNEFYQDCLFNDGDPDRYANNISEKCYDKLTVMSDDADIDTEEDADTTTAINWKLLGPGFESEREVKRDLPDLASHFEVEHYHDNWYRVRFSAHGTTEYRQIEAFPYGNKIIINDFR